MEKRLKLLSRNRSDRERPVKQHPIHPYYKSYICLCFFQLAPREAVFKKGHHNVYICFLFFELSDRGENLY